MSKLALRAEAIVKELDPSRIKNVLSPRFRQPGIDAHAGQFLSEFRAHPGAFPDWFEHWATTGVKPAFPCEYKAYPSHGTGRCTAAGTRDNALSAVPRCPGNSASPSGMPSFSETGLSILPKRRSETVRWEAGQFKAGKLWHRWDYPTSLGSSSFDERQEIFARYVSDNWRAHRTWGLSGNSPWEYGIFWRLRNGVDRRRKELPVDWEHLQKPGFAVLI